MAGSMHIPVWRDIGESPLPDIADEKIETLIVGAGPVGLTIALDLALKGHSVTILSKLDFIAAGSKAICFAKRTLDIWDRLGVADQMVSQGVVWDTGKTFWGANAEPVYEFDLLPVKNQKMPAFINLQQYHVETILIERLLQLPNVTMRWGHKIAGIISEPHSVTVKVSTTSGDYDIETKWLIACDGSKSTIRDLMGLSFEGRVFEDNFLIADIKMKNTHPSERWFWFDPPFNQGQSALLHKQPDDVWRLDFQLGWDIDRAACIRPENVEPLVRGMLGDSIEFTPEWYSVYTFQCRRMARFVHGRVIFAGDSAHLVSPFGARGCNGGVADADNLSWKLDYVLRGLSSADFLESYNEEAIVTADENIKCSSRSTDFMTPKTDTSRAFRNAALELAKEHAFARPFINSGRLSTAVSYPHSYLNTADRDSWQSGIAPGSPAIDAPLGADWLMRTFKGRFVVLANGWKGALPKQLDILDISQLLESTSLIEERYELTPGAAYLIRPDQYVAGRWKQAALQDIELALDKATGVAKWA
jgi:3-(3-hydroxy-phenyl)propionate hydroxylase